MWRKTPTPYQRDVVAHASHVAAGGDSVKLLLGWATGLGKTLGALMIAQAVQARSVLVVCPKTVIPQWRRVVRSGPLRDADFRYATCAAFKKDPGETMLPTPDVLIVDEAHAFQSMTDHMQNALAHMASFRGHLLLLSGTPFVAEDDLAWVQQVLGCAALSELASRHLSLLTLDDVPWLRCRLPRVENHTHRVTLSWAHTALYLAGTRQSFSIRAGGDTYTVSTSRRAAWNAKEKSLCNHPEQLDVALSHKMQRVLAELGRDDKPHVVYSERIGCALGIIHQLARAQWPGRRVELVTGKTALVDRARTLRAFNQGAVDVLCFSNACREGVDLQHECHFHMVEAPESLRVLTQATNRCVRLSSRQATEAVIDVHRYVSVFPADFAAADWPRLRPTLGAIGFGEPWLQDLDARQDSLREHLLAVAQRETYDQKYDALVREQKLAMDQLHESLRPVALPLPATARKAAAWRKKHKITPYHVHAALGRPKGVKRTALKDALPWHKLGSLDQAVLAARQLYHGQEAKVNTNQ